jgi:GntR family transcriptional regulator
LFITLNYKSKTPLSDQLCDSIAQLAACCGLSPGEALPSVRALAQELGVNPNTVQKSYRMLEQQGVIESVPGKGSFVAQGDAARERLRTAGRAVLEESIQKALNWGLSPVEIARICGEYLEKKGGTRHD